MIDLTKYNVLFLDRDGVINVERKNDYVKNINEFVFEASALEAIRILSTKFEKIFIVTNQRGVGRGVMSELDLNQIHNFMLDKIKKTGGNIHNIYSCFDLMHYSINRKPSIGMAFKALDDYPEMDFNKSVMVGNSKSDIQFGNKLNMYTVLVGAKYPKGDEIYDNSCAYFLNLYQFALSL